MLRNNNSISFTILNADSERLYVYIYRINKRNINAVYLYTKTIIYIESPLIRNSPRR